MRQFKKLAVLSTLVFVPFWGCAQQQADDAFTPEFEKPLFEQGKGPVMLVDGGHNNFHTLEDKFAAFGKVAATDGFRVRNIPGKIEPGLLDDARILVIANALDEKNVDSWQQPVHPAFTAEEVEHIRSWVWKGGRLFLIADHMPFPGAVADIASSMGFIFYDGFALCKPKTKFDLFSFDNGMLKHCEITGLHGSLDSIVTFTGQGFKIHDSAVSVIT
ncbi:MAG TPA: DUF4350 domain-containing protein, partial [Chitinophagaceae bacterium]|nr:DUF4350 domain-containing protein [Chitinophagaceae bacterium]